MSEADEYTPEYIQKLRDDLPEQPWELPELKHETRELDPAEIPCGSRLNLTIKNQSLLLNCELYSTHATKHRATLISEDVDATPVMVIW